MQALGENLHRIGHHRGKIPLSDLVSLHMALEYQSYRLNLLGRLFVCALHKLHSLQNDTNPEPIPRHFPSYHKDRSHLLERLTLLPQR